MTEIHLSSNNLNGTIPDDVTFLRHLKILDLSDNTLSGSIPPALWLPPLNHLDISGNKLTGRISSKLCQKGELNENGNNGVTNCNRIACNIGTYNKLGNSVSSIPCHTCHQSIYLGSKTCPSPISVFAVIWTFGIFLSIGVVIGCVVTLVRSRNDIVESDHDENSILDHINFLDADDTDTVGTDQYWQTPHTTIIYPGQTTFEENGMDDSSSTMPLVKTGTFAAPPDTNSLDGKEVWLDVPKIT